MSRGLHTALLVLCAAFSVAHIALFEHWAVEDAAISWAYVETLAAGLGAVPWPGAEPVEGFSNPTWVALLLVLRGLGLHVATASKLLSMALTAGTVFVVARLGSRSFPERPQVASVTAAALFALNSQVGIFGAAGLENPLFNLLLALGLLRLFDEQQHPGRRPLSGLVFMALAITRPEGLAYGLVAGALSTAVRLREGRERQEIARWWLALLAPLLLWHLARWSYFAWELPATAYAKLPGDRAHLLQWNGPGWTYLRDWATASGHGYFVPLYLVAIGGLRGRPARLAGVLLVGWALLYGYPDAAGQPGFDALPYRPDALLQSRCLFPLIAGAVLWAASWETPWFGTRGTLWAMAMIAGFFAVYARGDWMDGARWFTMAAVPASVLLATGLLELVSVVHSPPLRWARWVGPAVGVLAFATFQGTHSLAFSETREISPWMVRGRVWKGLHAVERLHLDERPRILTVDMGGFLMWSGFEHNDIVGLTDMPMAQNRSKPWFEPFFDEYILGERKPHFIRIGNIMNRVKRVPGFEEEYFVSMHGWRMRADLFFEERWEQPEERRVAFDGQTLEGWRVPAQPVAPGTEVYLELGLRNHDQRPGRWYAFALDPSDEVVAVWELPIYLPEPALWPDAVYVGRHSLALPDDLPPGEYRLGFAMRTQDANNGALPDQPLGPGVGLPRPAHFRPGEVLFSEGFTIASEEAAEAAARADLDEALELAAADRCDAAQRAWFLSRRHGLGDPWEQAHRAAARRALAACHVAHADQHPETRVDHLERAATLDASLPGLTERLHTEADALVAEGNQARRKGRLNAAFTAYRDALRLDPYRPWIRRKAEEIRARRLGGMVD